MVRRDVWCPYNACTYVGIYFCSAMWALYQFLSGRRRIGRFIQVIEIIFIKNSTINSCSNFNRKFYKT